MNVLGIDIGGSAVKGAPVDTATGKLLAERFRIETPTKITPQAMGTILAKIARHFDWHGPVGVGFPGVARRGQLFTSANLHPKFIGFEAQKQFSKACRCPVRVANDAEAAAIAEMRFGAGQKFTGTALVLTLGTGVGSVLFHKGTVIPCELGHLPIEGIDAEKRVAASVRTAENLSWKKWGRRLSKYLDVLEALFWPELIIVGGGVSARHEKFFKYLPTKARLVPAKLQNDAGIVGAALVGETKN